MKICSTQSIHTTFIHYIHSQQLLSISNMAKKENKRKAPTKGKGSREEKRKRKKAADKEKRKRERDEDEKPNATAKSGPGVTMIKVMRAKDGKPLGYYNNKMRADKAMGAQRSAAKNALNKKGDNKGVVGKDGLFKVEEVHNCTEPEGPTALGMQEGKWKMADHAPGPGSGSNHSRIGITLGRCLNSSKEKIPNDPKGRTFGDVIKGVASKHGVQRHGFVVYDGDMFAKLMAWEKKDIGSKLAKLKKKGSNKKSRRLDDGKKGSFPQFWYVNGLKRGLDDYSVFALY